MGGYYERWEFSSNLHLLNYNHQRKMPDYYTLGYVRISDQESQIVFNSFS